MSLIIKSPIDDILGFVCSRNFVSKIFAIKNKISIKKHNNGVNMSFDRVYNNSDLNTIDGFDIPDNIREFVGEKLDGFDVVMNTHHDIIKHDENSFIVKYTSILHEPEYLYNIIGETKIVLYVQYSVNPVDKELITVNFTKKVVNSDESDDDTLILNLDQNDCIQNIYDKKELVLPKNVIAISKTVVGKDFFTRVVLPFVNSLYTAVFDIIQEVYVQRLIKFMTKKQIEIYKKK